MDAGQYDKAESIFKQCLAQRDDKEVKDNLSKIKKYKEYKKIYDQAIILIKNKKYDKAIEEFKKIPNSVDKLYKNAQSKIRKCEKIKKQEEEKGFTERKDSHIATWSWYTVSQDESVVDGITGEELN